MPRYQGKFKRQITPSDPYGKYNCSAYCLALLIQNVTAGGCDVSGEVVREMSDEPKPSPASPGLNLRQLDHVAADLRVHFYDKSGTTWASLYGYLGTRDALVQVDYKTMGVYRAQANGDFSHALLLMGKRTIGTRSDVYTYDPLAREHRWIPASVIRAAAEKFAQDTGMDRGIRYAVGNPVPRTIS